MTGFLSPREKRNDIAPFVALKDIAMGWNGQLGVEGTTLDIPDGRFAAFPGPSGSGKSTTLRLLAELELPDESLIPIDGRDITTSAASERNPSMVFQLLHCSPTCPSLKPLSLALKSAESQNAGGRSLLS